MPPRAPLGHPDQGQSEPGQLGDSSQSDLWDLNGDRVYVDASGPQPDVTAFMHASGRVR